MASVVTATVGMRRAGDDGGARSYRRLSLGYQWTKLLVYRWPTQLSMTETYVKTEAARPDTNHYPTCIARIDAPSIPGARFS